MKYGLRKPLSKDMPSTYSSVVSAVLDSSIGLLDLRDAVVADLGDRLGDDLADLDVVVGADRGDLLKVRLALAGRGEAGDRVGGGVGGGVDAPLHRDGVGAGGDVLEAALEDAAREDGGGGGAVAGDVRGLLGDLLDHLRAHVLEGLGKIDLLGDGDAVLGDGGAAPGLLEDHVVALRAHGDADGVAELLDALAQLGVGVAGELHLLGGHGWLPCESRMRRRDEVGAISPRRGRAARSRE
jgi:hypothetical protein